VKPRATAGFDGPTSRTSRLSFAMCCLPVLFAKC
jgi:hypothetical protein